MTAPTVVKNKVVTLTYTLRDQRGEIVEHSDLPIAYVHGAGSELFPQIEQALEGHGIDDAVIVSLAPADGFGAHDPSLTFTDDIDSVPPEYRHLGAQVEAENAKGEPITFVVTHIANGKLTVDANHPLAGQTVSFEVTIRDIREATAEELRSGHPAPTQGSAIQ